MALLRKLVTVCLWYSLCAWAIGDSTHDRHPHVSPSLFRELEELSRIVDISYCVGLTGTGIQKPFECLSRCADFDNFELIKTWNTGQLLSDSCGYIAISHTAAKPRIILAFRGTYSLANTVADLSTIPQEYVPYPGSDDEETSDGIQQPMSLDTKCTNCTVHMGFMRSWTHTKDHVTEAVEELLKKYPNYQLTLVGHSLGGAVAALASLDFKARGWNPQVTTFGEPRIGNAQMARYLDASFAESHGSNITRSYRRVTHVDDPVPLLPLTEWGYQPHSGEIYISKNEIPPQVEDLRHCIGDADPSCISGADSSVSELRAPLLEGDLTAESLRNWLSETWDGLSIPARWRIWEIFFAHRDYFWRLGLCIPGGDPKDKYSGNKSDDVDLEL